MSGSASDDRPANKVIDLNTADEETLAGLPGIGRERARELIAHRPYDDWDQVQKVSGVGGEIVNVLAMAGVQIGN